MFVGKFRLIEVEKRKGMVAKRLDLQGIPTSQPLSG